MARRLQGTRATIIRGATRLLTLALTAAVIGALPQQAEAAPVAPMSIAGCYRHGLITSGIGERAWVECGGQPDIASFRTAAICNSGNEVYGPWVPDDYSRSTTGRCWTGVHTILAQFLPR